MSVHDPIGVAPQEPHPDPDPPAPGPRPDPPTPAGTELATALGQPDAPTALFVSNDIGAILHRISLTTVAQSLDFQAERAVALLLERIENPRIAPRHESAPVELKVRDSTAPPPR